MPSQLSSRISGLRDAPAPKKAAEILKRIALLREMFPAISKLACLTLRFQWERIQGPAMRAACEAAGLPFVSVLLELPASVILDLISRRPAACIVLLECVSGMVRRMTGVAADLVLLDLRQRVAKYLLEDPLADSRSTANRLTQSEVAASIGASRQRVNACLRDFERQGWISMESRRLRVMDPEGLADGAGL